MKFRELGRTGEKISCIGMGTWKMGYDSKKEAAAISEGLRLGINLVDTAEMYNTEELVGRAIKGTGAFVATKVSPHHFRRSELIKACNASLKRLGVKSIDLYQLHWPNPNVPIKETMGAMEYLLDEGKIRYIGVSNFSARELREAQNALKHSDIVSNQVEFSPFVREIYDYLSKFCIRNHISLLAYSPLWRGSVGELSRSRLYAELKEIGERHGSTPFQVALSWLCSKPQAIPIPKAASVAHVRENAAAAELKLSKEEIDAINSADEVSIPPLASKLSGMAKKTTPLWSSIMQKRERLRKHGI